MLLRQRRWGRLLTGRWTGCEDNITGPMWEASSYCIISALLIFTTCTYPMGHNNSGTDQYNFEHQMRELVSPSMNQSHRSQHTIYHSPSNPR